MTGEKRLCPHCSKPLRSNNNRGVCKTCWDVGKRPVADPADDSVLSRMGFNVGRADEAPPPATEKTPKKVTPRAAAPASAGAPVPKWQGAFRALAAALGLNPDGMLEDFCRDWVEVTRTRALAEPQKQLPPGVVEGELARSEA